MKKFIEELKKIFPYNKSAAIELILALTFSHELPGNSVVLLTESSFFQRKYSSLYLMLNNYFCARNTKLRTTQKIKTGYNALCLATQYRTINANIIQSI